MSEYSDQLATDQMNDQMIIYQLLDDLEVEKCRLNKALELLGKMTGKDWKRPHLDAEIKFETADKKNEPEGVDESKNNTDD